MSKVLDVIVRSLSYIKLHRQPHLIPVEMFKLVSKRSSVFESARSVRLTHQEKWSGFTWLYGRCVDVLSSLIHSLKGPRFFGSPRRARQANVN